MAFLKIKKIVQTTLHRMKEHGELPTNDPSAAGLTSSVIRTIAELEVARQERVAEPEAPVATSFEEARTSADDPAARAAA